MFNYNKFLEKILIPLYGYLFDNKFDKNIAEINRNIKLSELELIELQNKKLEHILKNAISFSPYYKSLNLSFINDPILFLKTFPVLDKKTLNKHNIDLLTCNIKKLLKQNSSGSSGVQSTVYWSKLEQSYHRANQILWWQWAGYKLGMPILQTGITPKRGLFKKIKDIVLNTYYIPAFVSSESNFNKAIDWVKTKNNVFLAGYASSLYVLSKFSKDKLKSVSFANAVCWGDKLFDHYRQSINDAFDVSIKETYGSAEGLMIAAQKDLPYMYIMTPNIYLELLDDFGNEVNDGEIGHVVVTSLIAESMPLIRYKLGDLAIRLPHNKYPYKREFNLPLLQKVIGRDTDLVRTSSGKFMIVHTFTGIFEHYPEIEQFCVIQKDLNSIDIEYIPRITFENKILEEIKNRILYFLNEHHFEINFFEVKSIKPTPSGKPQIIVSHLNKTN
jgi:phenylacetate-CoA ligase